jgi:hypothetical protein
LMLNKNIFEKDPTAYSIPNDGVAKVDQLPADAISNEDKKRWEAAQYECTSFVCEGSYRKGLTDILSAYLKSLGEPTQRAVWVHGFYGCGKSHLVRVLEFLWNDVAFPDGSTARVATNLPEDVNDLLKELTTAGKQRGGLWAAAGTVSAGGSDARAAILSVVLRSAGLPETISHALLDLWIRREGWYDAIKAGLEAEVRQYEREIKRPFVSNPLAKQLLKANPSFANSEAEALESIRAQFAGVKEVTNEILVDAIQQVLELKSDKPGKLPCMLLVLDELQQYLGDDQARTMDVQEAVEACVSRFGGAVLFVATGQSALQATPILSKLIGRFTIPVHLEDKDVEKVLQQTVLRKKPSAMAQLDAALDKSRGEIDRQLKGSTIAPNAGDVPALAADYPILPARRRFWERVMRVVGTGTAGQLRTQLRLAHEAAQTVANEPLGTVVGGDFIYSQQRDVFLLNSTLLNEIDLTIQKLDDGTPEGELKSRICATVFLIDKLPEEVNLKATAEVIEDLLVADLGSGDTTIRQNVPKLLEGLTQTGGGPEGNAPALISMDGVYKLQTPEGAEWDLDYQKKLAVNTNDTGGIAYSRDEQIRSIVTSIVSNIKLNQGDSKTPRQLDIAYGTDAPVVTSKVPVWVRTEWDVTLAEVRKEAASAGADSPTVFVFIPRQNDDEIKNHVAGYNAAMQVMDTRTAPSTEAGKVAKAGIEARKKYHEDSLKEILSNAVSEARVFQGGGTEATAVISDLQALVSTAAEASLARLFPRFKDADSNSWSKVMDCAKKGQTNALEAIGYSGDASRHLVVREVHAFLGTKDVAGSDVRKHFGAPQYGWPQDAVDASLTVLLANGLIKASNKGQPVAASQLQANNIPGTLFRSETAIVTAEHRIAVRKLLIGCGIQCVAGEEAIRAPKLITAITTLAEEAGGLPPMPQKAGTDYLDDLESLSGNDLVLEIYNNRDKLAADHKAWKAAADAAVVRLPKWDQLVTLVGHAKTLPEYKSLSEETQAIKTQRSLLADPDLVTPLIQKSGTDLRTAIKAARQKHLDAYDEKIGDLLANPSWQKLRIAKQDDIRERHGLVELPELRIGTDGELLAELAVNSLPSWEDKTAAVATRVAQALLDAERELEPKAKSYLLPKATVRNAGELETYLDGVREKVLKIIQDGPVVLS